MVNDLRLDSVAVADRLRPVLLTLTPELRREAREFGVTGGQVSLLVLIRATPGIGVNDLAARERMSAAAMSGYVKRLEQAGLVRRTASTADLRRHGLWLTEEGERVLRRVRRRRTAWLAERLEGLSPEELAAVDAAIAPLARLLESPR